MLHKIILLLCVLFPFCQSSGYIELRLKSVIDLPNATFNINYYWNSSVEKKVYDISLVANKTRIVTAIPVDFTRSPHVLMYMDTGPVNKYGFYRRAIYMDGESTVVKINDKQVDLPFTGMRIDYVCDRNWHGADCNQFCNNDYAAIVGRRCTGRGTVGCRLGYHGPRCAKLIDQKASECQCQNGGICVSSLESARDSKDDLICECPIGWQGEKCEKNYASRWIAYADYDKNGKNFFNENNEYNDDRIVDNEFYEKPPSPDKLAGGVLSSLFRFPSKYVTGLF